MLHLAIYANSDAVFSQLAVQLLAQCSGGGVRGLFCSLGPLLSELAHTKSFRIFLISPCAKPTTTTTTLAETGWKE